MLAALAFAKPRPAPSTARVSPSVQLPATTTLMACIGSDSQSKSAAPAPPSGAAAPDSTNWATVVSQLMTGARFTGSILMTTVAATACSGPRAERPTAPAKVTERSGSARRSLRVLLKVTPRSRAETAAGVAPPTSASVQGVAGAPLPKGV